MIYILAAIRRARAVQTHSHTRAKKKTFPEKKKQKINSNVSEIQWNAPGE